MKILGWQTYRFDENREKGKLWQFKFCNGSWNMSELMKSSAHNFPFILLTENDKNSLFQLSKLASYPPRVNANNVTPCFYMFEQKNFFKSKSCIQIYMYMKKEAMTSSRLLFTDSYRLLRKCFVKIVNFTISYLHNFCTIFINFWLFCLNFFYYFYWIKLKHGLDTLAFN